MTLRELAHERWLTVPNALSVVRLAGVPLFLWLLLGPRADGWALVVLVASGITDWLDGRIARALDQYSRLGEMLDPLADRLYTVATLVAFLIRGIVPWWVLALIIGRDLVVSLALPLLRRKGYLAFPVLYIGKAATLNLLYAFPLLLLAQMDWRGADIARPFAYAFTTWGIALHLWSGTLYLVQLVRTEPAQLPERA
ncbi:cardiolipin synthase [Actinomycetospora succinea]|uniref:Cardiolipin synthase n=1 Tax=Actinomycetospora succinea TaxID=663603 RepID=A0A4R6V110_9PSEU|nr:CDP-alcohol phosphatidyltransferase family protein [Actinomycetospora succinea]TDQ51645.1 cardiolipin synthase [Actinomycetospora succinea]